MPMDSGFKTRLQNFSLESGQNQFKKLISHYILRGSTPQPAEMAESSSWIKMVNEDLTDTLSEEMTKWLSVECLPPAVQLQNSYFVVCGCCSVFIFKVAAPEKKRKPQTENHLQNGWKSQFGFKLVSSFSDARFTTW